MEDGGEQEVEGIVEVFEGETETLLVECCWSCERSKPLAKAARREILGGRFDGDVERFILKGTVDANGDATLK